MNITKNIVCQLKKCIVVVDLIINLIKSQTSINIKHQRYNCLQFFYGSTGTCMTYRSIKYIVLVQVQTKNAFLSHRYFYQAKVLEVGGRWFLYDYSNNIKPCYKLNYLKSSKRHKPSSYVPFLVPVIDCSKLQTLLQQEKGPQQAVVKHVLLRPHLKITDTHLQHRWLTTATCRSAHTNSPLLHSAKLGLVIYIKCMYVCSPCILLPSASP